MKKIVVFIFLCLIIQGCGSAYKIQANKSKNFPPLQEMKIAVLPFIAPAPQTIKKISSIEFIPDNAGSAAADSISSALIGVPNIVLIERSQLEKILSEHKLSIAGVINNPDFTLLGKILPLDALVLGNITTFSRVSSAVHFAGLVAFSARLVNIHTGEILFTINCNAVKQHFMPEDIINDLASDSIKKLLDK